MSDDYFDMGVLSEPETHVQAAPSLDYISGTPGYPIDQYFSALACSPMFGIAILAERLHAAPVDEKDQTIEYLLLKNAILSKIHDLSEKLGEDFTAQDFAATFTVREIPLPANVKTSFKEIK